MNENSTLLQLRDLAYILGLHHFGIRAPYQKIYEEFGLTAEHVVEAAKSLL
jgi:transketolase